MNSETVRAHLRGKRIVVFPYSHNDWAWTFSRRLHADRYVRVFDEALDLADRDPGFCFFMDSLAESLEPYFEERPEAIGRWRRLIEEGRFGLVGGHYSNVRPATAPEEAYLRNLEEGRRRLAEWFPGFRARGFANVDTGIGHSQLPQVLSLAGFEYHLAGRPEMALEKEGLPKLFRWRGHAGSELVTSVQHYAFFCHSIMKMGQFDGKDLEAAHERLLRLLSAYADLSVDTLYAFVSMDDMRPLRDHLTDAPYDLARAIREWNRDEDVTLEVGTPDRFFEALATQRDRLPIIEGPVDRTDVGYNGPFSPGTLRPDRDAASACLVEAEAYEALASLATAPASQESLREAWRLTLRAQTHAMQMLFAEDWDAVRLDLLNARGAADTARRAALSNLAPIRSPQDAQGVTIFTVCPHRTKRLISVPVLRSNFQVAGYEVIDSAGLKPPQQAVEMRNNPIRPGEWDILVQCDLPACGARAFTLAATSVRAFPKPRDLPLDGESIAGPWRLTWRAGHLASLRRAEGQLAETEASSLLEPVAYPTRTEGWMLTHMAQEPVRTGFTALRQTEFGPLRWRFERAGKIQHHDIFQDLQLSFDGRIEVVTDVNYGADTCCFALTLPCPPNASLQASIPFGVEDRNLESTIYSTPASADTFGDQLIERLIPGMFYARDWVQATDAGSPFALVVMDGDRYWRRPPGHDVLAHLLLCCARPAREGWVRYTRLTGAGQMRFRHHLCVGEAATDVAQLSHLADEARFPPRVEYTDDAGRDEPREWLQIEPGHLRLLACRRVDGEIEIRLVEAADRAAEVRVILGRKPASARLTDLTGSELPDRVELRGAEVRFAIAPWQIRNLRLTDAAESS